MKDALVALATALAIMVLPVPGGPYINTPLGGSIPICLYSSKCVRGSSTASFTCETNEKYQKAANAQYQCTSQGRETLEHGATNITGDDRGVREIGGNESLKRPESRGRCTEVMDAVTVREDTQFDSLIQ